MRARASRVTVTLYYDNEQRLELTLKTRVKSKVINTKKQVFFSISLLCLNLRRSVRRQNGVPFFLSFLFFFLILCFTVFGCRVIGNLVVVKGYTQRRNTRQNTRFLRSAFATSSSSVASRIDNPFVSAEQRENKETRKFLY